MLLLGPWWRWSAPVCILRWLFLPFIPVAVASVIIPAPAPFWLCHPAVVPVSAAVTVPVWLSVSVCLVPVSVFIPAAVLVSIPVSGIILPVRASAAVLLLLIAVIPFPPSWRRGPGPTTHKKLITPLLAAVVQVVPKCRLVQRWQVNLDTEARFCHAHAKFSDVYARHCRASRSIRTDTHAFQTVNPCVSPTERLSLHCNRVSPRLLLPSPRL